MSADVKANIKQEIRSGGLFYKEVPSKLEIQYKKWMYFSFDFGWYSIRLGIDHYGQGSGVVLLNRKNLKLDNIGSFHVR